MTKNDIDVLMGSVATVVRDFVDSAATKLGARIDAIAEKLAALPTPRDGRDAEPVDYAKVSSEIERQIAALPVPHNGKDGAPGRDGDVGAQGRQGDPGQPGRDADPVDYAKLFAEAGRLCRELFDAWPKPKDGEPGQKGDQGERGGDGKDGAPGRDGRDADPAEVTRLVAAGIEAALPIAIERAVQAAMPQLLARAVEMIPKPRDGVDGKDGAPGRDGRDVEPMSLEAIAALLDKAIAALPPAERGPAGRDADDAAILAALTEHMLRAVDALPKAQDGRPGRDADPVDLDAVVAKVVPLIRVPRDGTDGKDAEPVDVEAIVETVVKRLPTVENGRDGERGADGTSVGIDDIRPLLEAECARMQLEFERRATDGLQRTIDSWPKPKDGENGAPGRDAAQLETFDLQFAEGTVTVSLQCADGSKIERSVETGMPVFRGSYVHGTHYKRGSIVVYGGSGWITKRDTDTSPPGEDWQLFVRKGADGKGADGKDRK